MADSALSPLAATADGLCDFVDASPSPFHVCRTAADRLLAAGFTELSESDPWPAVGDHFVVRAGSLIAWRSGGPADAEAFRPFRIVGAHTDSPNLRVKQHPDRFVAGWQVVALQPYGGAWLNSWLDRELGISGRLSVRAGNAVEHRLVRLDEPLLRVPQLAIHLAEDRKAVELNPQRHVNAVWGVGGGTRSFLGHVADRTGVDAAEVLGFDLMTHDLAPSRWVGADGALVSAPRLDNQATCYAGLQAFLAAAAGGAATPVLVLFDHEEVGSQSDHGAQSDLLLTVLERITLAAGGDGRTSCAGCPNRWSPPATWRTPPTPTTRTGTNPDTSSRSTAGRCSRCSPTCATPPTDGPRPRSRWRARRPGCRCSATNTAPTCPAGPPSAP